MPRRVFSDDLVPSWWDPEWRQCLVAFLRYHTLQSEHTARSYWSMLSHFFADPTRSPALYHRADVEAYLHAKTAQGHDPSVATINHRLAAIASFYGFAGKFQVGNPPHPLFEGPSPTRDVEYGKPLYRHRAFSSGEIRTLFAAMPTDTVEGLLARALYWTFFVTGRRSEELLRLTWGDIERGTVLDEKGEERDIWVYRYYQKGAREQYARAQLPDSAKVAIDRYLAFSGRMEHIRPEDPVFVAARSRVLRPMSHDTAIRLLRKYASLAGIAPERVSVHAWRHSTVQRRLELGQPLLDVMKVTGHKSITAFYAYTDRLRATRDTGAPLLEDHFRDMLE